jgi:hypothetical protein
MDNIINLPPSGEGTPDLEENLVGCPVDLGFKVPQSDDMLAAFDATEARFIETTCNKMRAKFADYPFVYSLTISTWSQYYTPLPLAQRS